MDEQDNETSPVQKKLRICERGLQCRGRSHKQTLRSPLFKKEEGGKADGDVEEEEEEEYSSAVEGSEVMGKDTVNGEERVGVEGMSVETSDKTPSPILDPFCDPPEVKATKTGGGDGYFDFFRLSERVTEVERKVKTPSEREKGDRVVAGGASGKRAFRVRIPLCDVIDLCDD